MALIYTNPAQLLLILRDRGPMTFPEICNTFGVTYDHRQGFQSHFDLGLNKTLHEFRELGIIAFQNPSHATDLPPTGKFRLADKWLKIQETMDLSLREMATVEPGKTMTVKPLFGQPANNGSRRCDIFVAMPFRSDLDPVYKDHIKTVARRLDLTAKRADDFFGANMVMKDIWDSIALAKIMVADCTTRNPNVFYEVGLAHTIGLPTILITQCSDDVPFDVRHFRYILYHFTPRGMKALEDNLANSIQSIISEIP